MKEKTLLLTGLLLNQPLPYRHHLPALLLFLSLRGEGAEVGVRDGSYSKILLEYSNLTKLYSIDPWKEFDKKIYDDTSNAAQKKQEHLPTYMTMLK